MVRKQGMWIVLVALAASNTLPASVVRTTQAEFKHLYTLNPHRAEW